MKPWRQARWAIGGVCALSMAGTPTSANAHLINTGLGPLYDGAVHFAVSPEAVVPIVALALLAGLRGSAHARCAIILVPVAWILGGVAGIISGPVSIAGLLDCLPLLILGGLVAADFAVPFYGTFMLSLFLGLFAGYAFAASSEAPVETRDLIGSAFSVFVLMAVIAAFAVVAKWRWVRIGERVVGSWIAATGLLLAGWSLR